MKKGRERRRCRGGRQSLGQVSRERQQQYQQLEVELGSVKSLKYCYHLSTKLWEGNVLQALVILSMGGHIYPPLTVLLASGQYASYCNTVLFKLGLNCEMYSWIVHFLNYFISISERDIGTERQEAEGCGKVKSFYLFIYFFLFHSHLIHLHLIIQCKASFSSHFISLFFCCFFL